MKSDLSWSFSAHTRTTAGLWSAPFEGALHLFESEKSWRRPPPAG